MGRPPPAMPCCWPSDGPSPSRASAWSTPLGPTGPDPSHATDGCGSLTACGSWATRPGRSCTRTRPTTRASWPSGWRSAKHPARLPRAAAGDVHRPRAGLGRADPRRGAGGRARRLRAESPLPEVGEGIHGRGHDRAPDDRHRRGSRELVGAAMACPDASAAIHECVLAIKARVPVDVLAETIHAFPSTSHTSTASSPMLAAELDRPGEHQSRAQASNTTSPSRKTSDGQGRRRAHRPASTGSSMASRRDDRDVGTLTRDEPAAIGLPRP